MPPNNTHWTLTGSISSSLNLLEKSNLMKYLFTAINKRKIFDNYTAKLRKPIVKTWFTMNEFVIN